MEPSNLHQYQHQLQEQLVGSSSLATPSHCGVGSNHAWNPDIILNGGNFNPHVNGVLSNTRELRQKNNILVPPSVNTSMIQDLGFHWASHAGTFTNHSADELQLEKIKEELSDYFPKYNEMINSSSNVEEFHLPCTSYIKHRQEDLHDFSEKLLLKTIPSSCQVNGLQVSAGDLYSNAQNSGRFGGVTTSHRGNFSQIFPSTNISNMNPLSSPFPSSLDMNLQALDLLSTTKLSGSFTQPSNNNLGLLKENLSFSLNHMQESSQRLSNSQSKWTNGVTKTKRANSFSEPKTSHAAAKKPRFESRSSCPPFKVRKEKLGDRIAALQQLVAPFGKTDTSSVLSEAIGYINFLQGQVETLSVPYMKSSRIKNRRAMLGQQQGSSENERTEEPKRDLRSRGLCLVPLSCTSYVTNDCEAVWPPPNFRGGT
ncbi:hypothetical protein HHK36_008557 [Tetracentron sinense]|uniref:BHLH domain-containing protein n=1 Tax=Tetracentron sinense TaxID=13715 RepID=A0A834ZIP6_TETSI|nr:hypothetical protein HHK36_008557 [Tetracentron sinense]